MYFGLSPRKHMLGTHQNTKLLAKLCVKKICIFAQNAGMSLSTTLILCFLASVCPPHVRLHGGPSASPCLMPFSGEQRVFYMKVQTHSSAVMPSAGSARGQCRLCSSSCAAPFFRTQSCAYPASAASRELTSPTLREGVQD